MTSTPDVRLTSNRPYLLRAIYEWITDNHCTPYLLVDARRPHVIVPRQAVKDGQIVLNIAMRAVADLELGNESVRFHARFSGVSQQIQVPISAILAIYAQENGQGMMFPSELDPDAEIESEADVTVDPPPTAPEPDRPKRGPHLRIVK